MSLQQHKELCEQADELRTSLQDFSNLVRTTSTQLNSFNRLALKQASFFMAAHSIFEVETMKSVDPQPRFVAPEDEGGSEVV
ncbi:unnamed protein product [Kuraishia capsulata CBS 1993]|uniref:Uncharacterized protein n=1 Tax=Kuraishia capsulata CBS 1993 TaxID=1382522 RepID=W6MJM8_9ASCO|nr:uncharacterized protein KUCA_T00000638001 [Kuraishia capsulata CBS 1993]CDK24672.1 unnamed protein product [Kuraishia capsulata CBS 1993]